MDDFEPHFIDKHSKRLAGLPWLDFEDPEIILIQGMRNSGKSVTTEYIAEKFYDKGFNVWHLWGARSFENLYWVINKNCKQNYQNYKKEHVRKYNQENDTNKKESEFSWGLHCNCCKSYPITWLIPDYIDVNQESLDRFNGIYFTNFTEYSKYYKEITPEERGKLQRGELKKPKEVRPEPKILVRRFTTPTSQNRKEIFREQFTKIILEAREQHRIVVMNPAIFEGQTDKFETLACIINHLPYLMHMSGHFMPLSEKKLGKQKKNWSKWERNWEKVVIVINEIRSVAPSSRLSGETKAGVSKKAIFDKIPEMRHLKTWFIADYQNPDDLYAGVRYQANIVIIKRASRNILGQDWTWLFDKVENDQLRLFNQRFGDEKIEKKEELWRYRKIPAVNEFLNNSRPRVDNLDANVGYITFPNNEIKKVTFPMPNFHHKSSTSDDFMKDTGIRWQTNKEKKPTDQTDGSIEKKSAIQSKKKTKEEILKKIDYMRQIEGKSFEKIKEELVLMQTEGKIPDMDFANKGTLVLNNWYNRWKHSQTG